MSLVTLQGRSVLEARVVLPRVGRWVAELAVDSEEVPSGLVTLRLGSLELVGTASRAGSTRGRAVVELVGGRGGLLKPLEARAFSGTTSGVLLQDAASSSGEQLSAEVPASLLSVSVPRWTRFRRSLLEELQALLPTLGAGVVFRFEPGAALWVGVDDFPAASLAHTVLLEEPHLGRMTIGCDDPALLPGTTFLGRKVEEVVHRISDGAVRTELLFQVEASTGEAQPVGVARELARAAARAAPTLSVAVWPAQVVAQNGDGTLELIPDDARIPQLSRVPIRPFAPSVAVQVGPGSRCGVQFAGGDPQAPVVTWFELGALLSLELGGAVDQVALASRVEARLSALETAFNVHTHIAAAPGAPTAVPLPVVPPGALVASQLVKVGG